MEIIGRANELRQLYNLKKKKTSSLVAVQGRRRIGKSSLIEHFGKNFKYFYEFQGTAPHPKSTRQEQLTSFSDQFYKLFKRKANRFKTWSEALNALFEQCKDKEVLILLDEISWLCNQDKNFPGTLKIAWDTQFSKNSKLVLVLCGSVSSWIEENILKNAGFVGRISLVLRLSELNLKDCTYFWGSRNTRVSTHEKLKLLSVTGGVPKYLSEIHPQDTAEQNIKRLCFTKGEYLYEDFDRIFSDIFGTRSETYIRIIEKILLRAASVTEIAASLKRKVDRQFSNYIWDLETSGFISKEKSSQRNARFRISDNYLRFYLRYIKPNKDAIDQGLFEFSGFESLLGWDTIVGLQFENLILNRLPEIIQALKLSDEKIIYASPYIQRPTTRNKGCQIDLLIACKNNTFYICEIRFRKLIEASIIQEMERKLSSIVVPKRSSLRPVLLYAGELEPALVEKDFFDRILNVAELLA